MTQSRRLEVDPKVDWGAVKEAMRVHTDIFASSPASLVKPLRDSGATLRQVGTTLTERGIRSAHGGSWSADAVSSVLARLPA